MQAGIRLRMQQRTSLQLVMAGKLLQLSGPELEQAIIEEMAQNPALEMVQFADRAAAGTLSQTGPSSNQDRDGDDDIPIVETILEQPSAVDRLIADALLLLDQCDQHIAIYLLHSLDQHGYLRQTTPELAAEIGAPVATVARVIKVLQQLEPPGIAARDLRECLTIQCADLAATGADSGLAHQMVTECWDDFVSQRWERISHKLNVIQAEIDLARCVMKCFLYPYPLLLLDSAVSGEAEYSYVDLIVSREAGGTIYRLQLPGTEAFALRINASFVAAMHGENGCHLAVAEQAWVAERYNRARMFIAAVEQRWLTLRRIGDFLIRHQQAFLEEGPAHLQALTRAEVAAALNLHESTVSRAIRDKVVQLPSGRCAPLSAFFDRSLAAKEAIRRLLEGSSRPLSDQEVARRLQTDGLELARRTVNKYRRQLKMPSSHGRQVAALAGLG